MNFKDLDLHPDIMKGLEEAAFEKCTPVQEKTFEHTLNKRDVYVQSQTGTGKTAAFLITIFQLFKTDPDIRKRALILVPTRELAVQVEEEAAILGKYCGYKIGSFYGGVGYEKQEKLLKQQAEICVGTPGRLIDFCKSGKLDFSSFDILVIDEADRMFDMGFIPDIRYMIKKMPPLEKRLTMLYSATLSQRVKMLAWEYMNDPFEIEIEPDNITLDAITQELFHVPREDKFGLILGIIKRDNPESILIFTNTKRMAEILSDKLKANGITNQFITGDLPQHKRLSIIKGVKSGTIKALVATDVAARGLHIDDLALVVNYDLPDDCENYVHRIGRTARAGKSGKAISIACESYVYNLEAIEQFIGMKIPVNWEYEELMVTPVKSRRDSQTSSRRNESRDRYQGRKKHPAAAAPAKGSTTARHKKRDGAKQAESAASKSEHSHRKKAASAPAKPATMKKPVSAPRPGKNATEKERIAYYREKYGENFTKQKVKTGSESKKGLIGRIVSLIRRK